VNPIGRREPAAGSDAAVRTLHLSKTYLAGQYALHDLTLEVKKGEFVFLTGSSGAGKTSLLRLLFAAELPAAGQVLVSGRNLSRLKASQIPQLRREIGVIFQDFKLLGERTVFENVAVTLEIAGASRREIRARVWSILKRLGLGHRLDHRPRELSGGEQQRVAIGRALINRPKLILADEPTGDLDPENSSRVIEILDNVHREHKVTVLFATHAVDIVDRLQRRVVRLQNGRVVSDTRGGYWAGGEASTQ